MKLTIENYRGIKSAALNLDGIVLVGAPNAAGKSAIAQATGAVLAGQPIPIPGVLKTLAGMLVRMGASSGFAQLETGEGAARVEWPRAVLKTKGTLPHVSPVAAGLESLTTAEPKRRAEMLIELLNAQPTLDDLRAHLARDGISEETAARIWETIEKHGWDGAHALAKETGARLKGQWEAVTGERYGTKKAEAYTPRDWEPELAAESEESLAAKLTDARDTLDGMIAVAAIDDAERERLQRLADELPERQAAVKAAEEALRQAQADYAAKAKALQALRDPNAQAIHECPHCKGALSIAGGKIVAGSPISDDEASAWKAAEEAVAAAQSVGVGARNALNAAQAAARESEEAGKRLAALQGGNATQEQVERARQAVQLAQTRFDAFKAKTRADKLHESIIQNAAIVAALDTAGVRQEKLFASIDSFARESLEPLAHVAAWGRVEIASDMSLSYDGRVWTLLSESERFRVRVLLQVAAALRDGSRALVIDAADILDRAGRNGLIKLLRHADLPALVCMTLPTPNEAPDLQAAGIGESFWIRDGVALPLAEAKSTTTTTVA